jgi:predicted unusual protein kinase regulating ubiquinone biosynthesis (AarF/ABC1/UbiB family)/DNA-binding XRE family transcriptional regulator
MKLQESNANAARLIRLRSKLGFSQRELAKEFRVSPGAIGFWESGGRVIPGPVLKLIEAFEHHVAPSGSSIRGPSERPLDLLCAEWADKILSFIPTRTSRQQLLTLKAALKRLFHRYLSDHLSRDPIKRSVQLATYSRLIGQFDKAKGFPLKIIQLASHLDPDVPVELRECLVSLQSAVTGMPSGVAARVIYEEFGKRPAELFAEWSEKPIAAASIGQVHRAKLHSGEWVAVKVQYPRIREHLESAFTNPLVQDLLFTLIQTGSSEVLEDFKSRVLEECDYQKEAKNQVRFGEYFAKDLSIRIPKTYPRFCSERVLTSEYIKGLSFHEFVRTSSQETRNWAAETMVRFQGESFFWHNSLYVDIHPGNLLFMPGQMVFLDFGRVLYCEDRKFSLLGELTQNIMANDPLSGKKTIEALDLVRDWTDFDFNEFWQILREQHCHFWEDAPFEFNHAYLARKNQLMRSFRQKHAIQLTGPSFWNFFAVKTHDAIRADLSAKTNWRALMLKTIGTRPDERSES